jgi:hypothetical protein
MTAAVAILIVALLGATSSLRAEPSTTPIYRVDHIVDGDTIAQRNGQRVRLVICPRTARGLKGFNRSPYMRRSAANVEPTPTLGRLADRDRTSTQPGGRQQTLRFPATPGTHWGVSDWQLAASVDSGQIEVDLLPNSLLRSR